MSKKRSRLKKTLDIQKLLPKAQEAFEKDFYGKAIGLWSVSLPHNPRIKNYLAEAYFRQGLDFYSRYDFNSITSNLSQATRLNPQLPIYWFHLGLSCFKGKKLEKAISAFSKAVELNKNEERFLYHLALCYLLAHRYNEAQNLLAKIGESGFFLSFLRDFLKSGPEAALKTLNSFKGKKDSPFFFLSGYIHLYLEQYGQSVESFKKTIQKGLETPLIYYYLGLAYFQQNQFKQALEMWEKTKDLGLNLENLNKFLAKVYYLLGIKEFEGMHWGKAVRYWEKIDSLSPEEAKVNRKNLSQAYSLWGQELIEQGDIKKAASLWERAYQLNEDNPIILHNLALAYNCLERYREAAIYWQKLTKEWKEDYKKGKDEMKTIMAIAHRRLAENYLKDGKLGSAIEEYKKSLRYDPKDKKVRKELAELLMNNEKWGSALEHYTYIVDLQERDPEIYTNMGMIFRRMGEWGKAESCFFQALSLDSQNSFARKEIASEYTACAFNQLERGKREKAIEILDKALSIVPDDSYLFWAKGEILAKMGNSKQAEFWFEKSISIDPNNLSLYLSVGKSYLSKNNKRKAKMVFQRALEKFPANSKLLVDIGKVHLDFHMFKKAIFYLEKAVTIDPNDPEVHILLHICYDFLGKRGRALEEKKMAKKLAREQQNQTLLEEIEFMEDIF